jgi:acylphosphatase
MRAAFHVRGRVQGVGYRRFAQREAQALGLAGWVRNQLDGSVRGEVEGAPELLDICRARLQAGPTFGEVERLDWAPVPEESALPFPFEIRR